MTTKARGRAPFVNASKAAKVEAAKLSTSTKPPADNRNREQRKGAKDGQRKLTEQREARQKRQARQAAGDLQFNRR
jgi:hypothetical protein